jgi:hypothetical protein
MAPRGISMAIGMATVTCLMFATACGAEGGHGDSSPDVQVDADAPAEGASFDDYGVDPLDPSAVGACELLPEDELAELGLAVEGTEEHEVELATTCQVLAEEGILDLVVQGPADGSTAVEYLHGFVEEWGEAAESGELDGYPFVRSTEDPTCGTMIALSEQHLLWVETMVVDTDCEDVAALGAVALHNAPAA